MLTARSELPLPHPASLVASDPSRSPYSPRPAALRAIGPGNCRQFKWRRLQPEHRTRHARRDVRRGCRVSPAWLHFAFRHGPHWHWNLEERGDYRNPLGGDKRRRREFLDHQRPAAGVGLLQIGNQLSRAAGSIAPTSCSSAITCFKASGSAGLPDDFAEAAADDFAGACSAFSEALLRKGQGGLRTAEDRTNAGPAATQDASEARRGQSGPSRKPANGSPMLGGTFFPPPAPIGLCCARCIEKINPTG